MPLPMSFYNAMKGMKSISNAEGFGMQIIIDPNAVIPPQGETVHDVVERWGRQIAQATGATEALRMNGDTPEGQPRGSICFMFPSQERLAGFQAHFGAELEALSQARATAIGGRRL